MSRRPWILLAVLAVLAVSHALSAQTCASGWTAETYPANPPSSYVSASAVFDDGFGPALYVGDGYIAIGGSAAGTVRRKSPGGWTAVGAPFNGAVQCLAVVNLGGSPALYAGGTFNQCGGVTVNGIARWDGTAWTPLGSGLVWNGGNAYVWAIRGFNGGAGQRLYATGRFSSAGGVPASSIASWDGVTWTPLGGGFGPQNYVPIGYALAEYSDASGPALYVGGSFLAVDGLTALNIARWNGATWSAVGLFGTTGHVQALAVYDEGAGPCLFAGGAITAADGIGAARMARWDGTSWSGLSSLNIGGVVQGLTIFDDGSGPALFIGGSFLIPGVPGGYGALKWQNGPGTPLGTGVTPASPGSSPWIRALTSFDGGAGPELVCGGWFGAASGVVSPNLARWTAGGPPVVTQGPLGVTSAIGSQISLSVTVTGKSPFNFQWRKNGAPIAGATSSSFSIGTASPNDSGTYDVAVTNVCGSVPSAGALVLVPACALDFSHPWGPGSLRIRNLGGIPGAHYFSAFTCWSANATNFGNGIWSGLQITLEDLVYQFQSGAPPFVGTFDAAGQSTFDVPAFLLVPPLIGQTLYGITHTYDAVALSLTGHSNIASVLLQ